MASEEEPVTNIPKIKIVVIGDEEIGKTCLLISYRSDSSQSLPSVFNGITVNKTITRNNIEESVIIKLCDSSPDPVNKQFRVKSYKECDICLACFDILNLSSLQNIGTKWIPEIKQYAPNSLLILIGLKGDLRGPPQNTKENEISCDQINEYKSKYNIMDYIETSALKKTNVDKAFQLGIEKCLDSNNQYRESRAISTISTMSDTQDCTSVSPDSVMNIHKKQWNQHLQSMGIDSNDSALRNRDNTNSTFGIGSTQSSSSTLFTNGSGSSSYNTWQQPYNRNSQAYNMAMQHGMGVQQMQQQRLHMQQYQYQQQYQNMQNMQPRQGGTISTLMETDSSYESSMTMPLPKDKVDDKAPILVKKPENANLRSISDVKAVEIDYQLMDHDEEQNKNKCCCVVL